MTPKQKQLKLASIIALITASGFQQDHYGNYKRDFADRTYRIKIKKVNIRIESKRPGSPSWHKTLSQPIVSIEIPKLVSFMTKFLQA